MVVRCVVLIGIVHQFQLEQPEMEMTFPLKETKAILQLCENAGMPLTLILEASGRPIVFRMKFYSHFDVDFVVATAIPNSSQTTPSSASHTSGTQSMHDYHHITPAYRGRMLPPVLTTILRLSLLCIHGSQAKLKAADQVLLLAVDHLHLLPLLRIIHQRQCHRLSTNRHQYRHNTERPNTLVPQQP
jgi:hypothetical protein